MKMEKLQLNKLQQIFRLKSALRREILCEFIATTFFMFIGLSVDAQMYLSRFQTNSHLAHSIGWGLALVLSVHMVFQVSGAHLNPAVSLFAWSFGKLPFSHFLLYSLAQTVGAFVGAALTFSVYFDKIAEFDGGIRSVGGPMGTAIVFSTYPGAHLTVLGAMIDQIACSAILCLSIGIITDQRNRIPTVAQPSLMGLMLAVICMAFGLNAGNAMNPARDFGPRLFTLFAGYSWEVFSYNNYNWFWIPIMCPFIGALIGAWSYKLIVSSQLPLFTQDEEEKNQEEELSFPSNNKSSSTKSFNSSLSTTGTIV